jgi:division protein CdvB (Snf7/Vps24/ESCRT-III family)
VTTENRKSVREAQDRDKDKEWMANKFAKDCQKRRRLITASVSVRRLDSSMAARARCFGKVWIQDRPSPPHP